MTRPFSGGELAQKIGERFPEAVAEAADGAVVLRGEALLEVARFLKETPGLEFDYLAAVTGVDFIDYFEVVYHLASIRHNHGVVLKVRCYEREDAVVPSLTGLWRGADLQEREVYDLMGIRFEGHPNLKRVLLWEGFEGHPLRKDYL